MDISYGSLTVPVLAGLAGAAVATLLAIAVRGELRVLATALVGIAAIVAVLIVGGAALDRVTSAQQAASRQALDARRTALMHRASASGSALACIDGLVGEAVQDACRAAVFASPQTIAAAVALAAERLNLLTDGLTYAQRFNSGYAGHLAGLRRAVENDAYGLYSHVLATRDGCTADKCAAFALLTDDKTVKAHLREQTYAHRIAENSGRWAAAAPAKPAIVAASQPAALSAASKVAMPSPPAAPVAAAAASASSSPSSTSSVSLSTASIFDKSRPHVPLSMTWPPTADSELIMAPVVVPPVASVLPDLEYPSAASIPPVSIMAPEPRAKTASSQAPAKAVPLPRSAPRPQAQ